MNVPLYDTTDYGQAVPVSLASFEPGLWQSAKAAFGQAWRANPVQAFINAPVLAGAEFLDGAFESTASDIDIVNSLGERGRRAGLPLEEQRRRIEEAGLGDSIKPDASYSEEALNLVIDSARLERSAAVTSGAAPAWHFPFSLAASFAAGLCDPVNIASAFVPVIGEQRIMALLGTGALGSAALSGAVSGAIASAAIEPLMAASHAQLQADYSAVNSLLNISLGAIMGSAAQAISGVAGRRLASRAEAPQRSLAPDAPDSLQPLPGAGFANTADSTQAVNVADSVNPAVNQADQAAATFQANPAQPGHESFGANPDQAASQTALERTDPNSPAQSPDNLQSDAPDQIIPGNLHSGSPGPDISTNLQFDSPGKNIPDNLQSGLPDQNLPGNRQSLSIDHSEPQSPFQADGLPASGLSPDPASEALPNLRPDSPALSSSQPPIERAQAQFELALADINTRRWERLFTDDDAAIPQKSATTRDELAELDAACRYASSQTDAAFAAEQIVDRQRLDSLSLERQSSLSQLDAEASRIGEQAQALESFLACVL